MVVEQAMEAIEQSYDTPLTAVLDVYRQMVVDPAWAKYDQLKAAGAKNYYKNSVGAVGPVAAVKLIPFLLQMYPAKGWTEAQLRKELARVVFPALAEQKSGPAPKVPAPPPEPPSVTEWLQRQRAPKVPVPRAKVPSFMEWLQQQRAP
jgi:hypothetical protein